MPQISFYPLPDPDPDSRLFFSCRLAEKARRRGLKVSILVDSEQQGGQLDTLLWDFKSSGFLPHSKPDENKKDELEAVLVGTEIGQLTHNDMLINLTTRPCQEHERFTRIDEILCADEQILAGGRELFRYYRAQGYEPKTHKL